MKNLSKSIEKLVEDELSDAHRLELLETIDRDYPERWREVSLGYMEAQLLRSALKLEAAPHPQLTTRRPLLGKWAAAAALILGLIAGVLINGEADPSPQVAGVRKNPSITPPNYEMVSIRGADNTELQIPLLDGSASNSAGRLALQKAMQPIREVNRAFEAQGQQSPITTSFYTIDLDDDRQLVIPVSFRSDRPQPLPNNTEN